MFKKISAPTLVLILSAAIIVVMIISVPFAGAVYAYSENDTVYLGGTPLGIEAISEYFIVSEIVNVTTKDGCFSPALQSGIVKGDILVLLNGKRIENIVQFNAEIQNSENEVTLTVRRGDVLTDFVVVPAYDIAQNQKKIGLMLKNEIAGIGTLTFITKENRYGALGHMIVDSFGYGGIYSYGNVYDCNIGGFHRAEGNTPGELRGKIDYSTKTGTIDKNIFCGIYGEMNSYAHELKEIEIGLRDTVKSGKAQIYTTIDGVTPRFYEIEIIKAVKQNSPSDKGMVIRIVDKDLKNTTGGILQGMSGSPIIQDGKLIGAVTHVFTADSTKGYGIYIDWMLPNA